MADTVTPPQPSETMGNVDQPKKSEPIDMTLPYITISVFAFIFLVIGVVVAVHKIRRLEFVRRFRARHHRDPHIRDLELQPQMPVTPGQRHMRDLEAARAANLSRAAPPCRPHPPVNPQNQRSSSRQRYNDRVAQQLANGPRPQPQQAWPRSDRGQTRRFVPPFQPSAAFLARGPPAAAPRAPPAAVPRAPPTTPRPVEHHHQDVSFGSETTRVNSARALPSHDDPLPDPYQFEFSKHAQPGPVRPDSPPAASPPVNQFPYDSHQFEFSEHAQTRPHRAHPSSAAIDRTVSPLDTSDITSSDARASIVSALSDDEYHQGNMPSAPEPTVNPYGWSHTPRSVGPQPTTRSAGPPRQAPPRRAVAPPRPSRSPEPEQPGVDLSNLYRPNN